MSTKTQKELIGSYRELLETLHVHTNEGSDLLSFVISTDELEHSVPLMVNDKRLALPTQEVLASLKNGDVMAFHPLSEHTLRGESEVIKWLKENITFNVSYTLTNLILSLSELSVSSDQQKKTTSKQSEFLKIASNANDKTHAAINKLLTKHNDRLVNLYNKRDGVKGDETFRRLVVVNYPILEELEKPGTKVYDVEMGSKKNKETVKAIFEYVINPQVDYSAGSNSDVAPYFIGLINYYAGYLTHLNSLVHTYRKFIPDSKYLKIDNMDAFDAFMDDTILTKYKRAIPALEGNIGANSNKVEEVEKESIKPSRIVPDVSRATTSKTRTVVDTPQQRTVQPEPAIAAAVDGKRSWQDTMGDLQRGVPPQTNNRLVQQRTVQPVQPIQRSVGGNGGWRDQLGLPPQQQTQYSTQPRGGFAMGITHI